jgi:hypothetical protein
VSDIEFCGGPCDGRRETLKNCYDMNGELRQREGWPLIIEIRAHAGQPPPDQVVPHGTSVPGGRLVARYLLTPRVTPEGRQVYDHIPE